MRAFMMRHANFYVIKIRGIRFMEYPREAWSKLVGILIVAALPRARMDMHNRISALNSINYFRPA
jgi:hypothetical protein